MFYQWLWNLTVGYEDINAGFFALKKSLNLLDLDIMLFNGNYTIIKKFS